MKIKNRNILRKGKLLWNNTENNFMKRLKRPAGQLCFILLCVILSRFLIYITFCLWKQRTGQDISFFEAFSRFDTDWYKSIITEGYAVEPSAGDKLDSANWAFFPFMPMIIGLLHFVIPVNLDLLAFLLNSMFFTAALFIGFHYITEFHGNRQQAVIFILLMSFGVYNFYFSLLYTEALFFLLTASFFLAMKKKKYVLMGVIGAMASATRTIGIMLVFAVAIQYTMDFFHSEGPKTIQKYVMDFLGNIRLVLGTVLMPAGLFLYMLYLRILTGDTMAFVHIQIAWGKRESANPLRVLLNSLGNVDSFVFYLALWSLWGLYCIWMLAKKKHWAEAFVCMLFTVIPLSTSIIAMPRYLIGCFLPMLGFTGDVSEWSCDKKLLLIAGSFLFNFICLTAWFNGSGYVM